MVEIRLKDLVGDVSVEYVNAAFAEVGVAIEAHDEGLLNKKQI